MAACRPNWVFELETKGGLNEKGLDRKSFFYIFLWWHCKTKFQVVHATFFLFCFTPRKWQRPVANTLKECRRNNASTRSRRRDGHVRSSSSCPTMAFSRFFRGTEKSFIETRSFFRILGKLRSCIRCFQNMLGLFFKAFIWCVFKIRLVWNLNKCFKIFLEDRQFF